MSSKFNYNQQAIENLRIDRPEMLDRLVDGDSAREYHLSKSRAKFDKRISLQEAVEKYVNDGDIIADTGFSYVRTPLAAIFEIMRQRKHSLQWIGSPNNNHSWAGTFVSSEQTPSYAHSSYVGAEMRGFNKTYSNHVKEKRIRILSEWSHGTMALGLKAAQMGCPYLTTKQMLASDMIDYNPYLRVENDSMRMGEPVVAVPALYPDVAFIHCQQADMFGNGKIIGPSVNDIALAYAARKVIITCEEVVPDIEMRINTKDNVIPFMVVDAVVELPYGCMPGYCPGYYYWSREWWEWAVRIGFAGRDDHYGEDFLQYWIMESKDQYEFVDKLAKHMGGMRYIDNLRRIARAEEYMIEDSGVDFEYTQVIPKWPEMGGK